MYTLSTSSDSKLIQKWCRLSNKIGQKLRRIQWANFLQDDKVKILITVTDSIIHIKAPGAEHRRISPQES